MLVHIVPPLLCFLLTSTTLVLGILCLSIPNATINFLIPCIFKSMNENDDGDMTAMEQILTRLLGAVLVAYVMNSATFIFYGKTPKDSSNSSHIENSVPVPTMKHQSVNRAILTSSIYLGFSMLIVTAFEMSFYEFPSHSICKNNALDKETTFMNPLIISASFVILGLLGIMISFFPNNDTQNYEYSWKKCLCCCWSNNQRSRRRWQLPLFHGESIIDNDIENDQISPSPLLSDNYLQSDDVDDHNVSIEQSQDEWNDEPDVSVETSSQESQSQVESRITGTKRLLKLAGPHSFYLFIGCLVLLVRLPFSLSIPHFVSVTLGALARSEYNQAKINILFLFIFGTIDAVLDFFCVFLFGLANLKITRGLRIDLFMAILRQEMGFFDENKSGDLSSRLNSDCGNMASDLTWFFRFSIESVVRIFGIVLYMCLRAPKLAACAISVVPAVAIVNKFYGNWLSKNAQDVQTALAEANSVAQEALLNIRCVIAFASERIEEKKYHDKIDAHYNLNVKQLYATGFYYMAISTFLINTCVQTLLLYVGMQLIRTEQMRPEVLLAFMLYQSQLQNEVMNLFNSYTSLIKSSGAGSKVFELLDRVVPHPGLGSYDYLRAEQQQSHEKIDLGEIKIDNVTFSYPSRPKKEILKDLSLTVPKGKTIALIGKSGCGKSTLFSLLQRFYEPNDGEISISSPNGSSLKELNIVQYRKSIGVVTQDPILFSGTIKSNISYCIPEGTTDEAIEEAAKLANAHDFVDRFPNKYDTQVGERGVQLSGGERQRICIARAIISKPTLLLLDEATSSLDAQSEEKVQEALDHLIKQRHGIMTTIIIAHRLQTIQNVDKIVVVDKGRILEEGSYAQLIENKDSKYNSMMKGKTN